MLSDFMAARVAASAAAWARVASSVVAWARVAVSVATLSWLRRLHSVARSLICWLFASAFTRPVSAAAAWAAPSAAASSLRSDWFSATPSATAAWARVASLRSNWFSATPSATAAWARVASLRSDWLSALAVTRADFTRAMTSTCASPCVTAAVSWLCRDWPVVSAAMRRLAASSALVVNVATSLCSDCVSIFTRS